MARRPFDPKRVVVPPEELALTGAEDGETSDKRSAKDKPITVSQLTRMVKRVLTGHLPPTLIVTGELSNVSQPSSGHMYFTLKDAESEVRCVMWRSAVQRLRFAPEDGMEVLVTGGVDVYEPRGQYQLYARKLEPKGIGELELAFRQLREKLDREGLFDLAHKQPLPLYPQRIGVVTSETGAAVRDMVRTIARRFPCVTVLLHPVRVQGKGAAKEIAAAIRSLNRQAEGLCGIDLVIVGRGGGSLEDLWAFNEEVVARAIFAAKIPVISAVGHEVDVTISDLVADVRAATPTAAAEIAVPSLSEVLETIEALHTRLRRVLGHQLDLARRDLTAVERFELFRQPLSLVRRGEQQIDEVGSRFLFVMRRRIDEIRRLLYRAELALRTIHPQAVLQERHRRLIEAESRLRWAQGKRNLQAERALGRTNESLQAASPRHRIDRGWDALRHASKDLVDAVAAQRRDRVQRLEALRARLEASGHETILKRGFTITRRKRGGKIVTDPADVREGDRLTTETAGGEFDSRVVDKDQLDLFD